MRRSVRQLVARGRRLLVVGISLAGYLAAAFGFPLPARVAKDRSVPFPCQDRPCGCRSAAECWQSCCCFSREEHLAWARANNVTPPAEFAQGGWNDRPRRQAHATCCQTKKACCSTNGRAGWKPAPRGRARYVSGSFYLQCRGLVVGWVQSGAALPAPDTLTLSVETAPVAFLRWAPKRAARVAHAPPLPPPRSLAGC